MGPFGWLLLANGAWLFAIKVNDLIKKDFPYAYTKEYIDENGIKIFEVYFEHQKEKISVITVPICSEKNN